MSREKVSPLPVSAADLRDSNPGGFDRRGIAIIVWLGIFLSTFLLLAGPSRGLAIYRLCQDGGVTALWLAAMTGIGCGVWRLFRLSCDDTLLMLVTCAALGIGLSSLVMLGLGLCGAMDRPAAMMLLGVGLCIDAWLISKHRKGWNAERWIQTPARCEWLWIATAPLVATEVIAAFFPPGILWRDEPNGYDVVEYHLQVPREWFEAGRIFPLHHNVFSYLPFNIEMHDLLAMHLFGGPWAGMYTAQMMHVALAVLAALAAAALVKDRAGSAIAGVLVAGSPWIALLAPVAYVEGGMLLAATLAMGWAFRAKCKREYALAGALAGIATGAKLTAAIPLLLGVPIAIVLLSSDRTIERIKYAMLFVGVAMVVLSPWLIRNLVWAGNPVFPEAMHLFGRAHFTAVQEIRWERAYWPEEKYRSFAGRFAALWQQVLADARYAWVLFVLGIAAIVLRLRDRVAWKWLIVLLVQTVFWLGFTHVQSRFMVLVIPIFAILISQVNFRGWKSLATVGALASVTIAIVLVGRKLMPALNMDRQLVAMNAASGGASAGMLGRENLQWLTFMDIANLPPDQPVDLVGDAAAFRYQIPMTRLHYKTVFDVDSSDPKKSIVDDWLAGMPATPLVSVDVNELQRFAKTYYGLPPVK